jgi:heavy metal sensor kinase
MHCERLRAVFRTLRFRLTAWNVLVVLLLVALALFIVREGVRQTLLHELDRILIEDTMEIGLAVQRFAPELPPVYEELERKAEGHAQHGWFVQVCDERGRVLWASKNAPQLPPPTPRAVATTRTSLASYRLIQSQLERDRATPLLVRVGASLEPLREDLALLTRTMLIAFGLIALIVPLAGYWLTMRATQPIAQIISTTARLRPSNLDERLPLRGTSDELDQLSRTINSLLDRIAVYLEQKRDFLANAAHELRSPLAAIRSTVEVALNSERSPAEYADLLGDVLEECTRLGTLVNQLLLLAESDAGQLALERQAVPLEQVVQQSVDMFGGVAEAAGVLLKLAHLEPARVWGDEYHLRQVVNNLVDNAIKFTPAGGRVEVGVQQETTDQVRLWVADTGTGIAAQDLPRIFERFYQGDRARTERRGSGLGLSICQSILAALGGTIDVQSTPGQGSRFQVVLPAASASSVRPFG